MRRIWKSLGIATIAVIVVGVSAAWYLSRAEPSTSFRTVPASRTDIVATISATGTIVPEDVVDVGAQVNGQIASFGKDVDGKTVDYRSTVQEKAVLTRIDDALFQADVATAEAQLAQAKAQVTVNEANRDQAKAHLDQTQRDWDRAQKLSGSPALSATDFDTARSNYEQAVAGSAMAEANIVQARAAINMADAALLRARRNLAYCTIASPVDGVILDRRVEIGQTVVASLSAPSLFLIAKDLRRMEVLVQVNEADIGRVQPGQEVTFGTDAYPGEAFHGTVRKVRLNATQTQNVVTYTVEISAENADLKLLPYLTANVTFEVARRENVLAVPNAALRWSPREALRVALREPGRESARGSDRDSQQDSARGPESDSARDSTRDSTHDPARDSTRSSARDATSDATSDSKRGSDHRSDRDPNRGPSARANEKRAIVWLASPDGGLRRVRIQTGLSDGTLTEVVAGLDEGADVIVGEKSGPSAAAGAPAGASPFLPQVFRNRNAPAQPGSTTTNPANPATPRAPPR